MARIVVIAGGSGLIGREISKRLKRQGDEVRWLTRTPKTSDPYPSYQWDVEQQTIDKSVFEGATHVINLAGAGIADARWSDARKKLIISSRTESTRLLGESIAELNLPLKSYISASAIGFYGDRGSEWVDENSSAGKGFLSESTMAWEKAVDHLCQQTGIRTCKMRTGIALSPEGGALEKMLQPARFGVSGYFGDGTQYYSWIHLEDLAEIYIQALDDPGFIGAVNAVAPHPVRNLELAQVLAKAVRNPALAMPVPAFVLRMVFGEMSHTILDSTRVSAQKLQEGLGFEFKFPELRGALEDLLKPKA